MTSCDNEVVVSLDFISGSSLEDRLNDVIVIVLVIEATEDVIRVHEQRLQFINCSLVATPSVVTLFGTGVVHNAYKIVVFKNFDVVYVDVFECFLLDHDVAPYFKSRCERFPSTLTIIPEFYYFIISCLLLHLLLYLTSLLYLLLYLYTLYYT